ncbi:hypothetical protein LTR62_002315 [Meristemomyces frigidus]|uniref:RecQ-mediated genome instability protein 1 n=1 Tax=Meristemomyces frigidus TaxID=1508187 RepID=A0AAN7YQB7_9PEZI|nr:hypothetical protein LTR62_002315 [Meristemomyces frigidus]
MATSSPDEVSAPIQVYLTSKGTPPSPDWLQSFLPTIKLNTPIIALQKTALFRILATDLTTSLDKSSLVLLPATATTPAFKEQTIRGPLTVQVLDIEDIGHSRWSQVESIEAQERGETTKGREVIRVVPDEEADAAINTTQPASPGPHKLLLQDAAGTKIYAMELSSINGLNMQMTIGTKIVLRDVLVARGMLLLEGRTVQMLGGKVEVWEKKWREERKGRLTQGARG